MSESSHPLPRQSERQQSYTVSIIERDAGWYWSVVGPRRCSWSGTAESFERAGVEASIRLAQAHATYNAAPSRVVPR